MEFIIKAFTAYGNFLCDKALIFWTVWFALNLIAFIMYGADKSKAKKGKWRTPEATLIGVSLLYAGVGAFLGMQVFRHKTQHLKFTITVPLVMILQIASIVLAYIMVL